MRSTWRTCRWLFGARKSEFRRCRFLPSISISISISIPFISKPTQCVVSKVATTWKLTRTVAAERADTERLLSPRTILRISAEKQLCTRPN